MFSRLEFYENVGNSTSYNYTLTEQSSATKSLWGLTHEKVGLPKLACFDYGEDVRRGYRVKVRVRVRLDIEWDDG